MPADTGSTALSHYLSHVFVRLPKEILLLAGQRDEDGHPLFTFATYRVLEVILLHANWSKTRQGGIPGTWISMKRLGELVGVSENTVSEALARLGTGSYRDHRSGTQRHGLGIIRDANEDERAALTEGSPKLSGRPPRAYILRHPDLWDIPEAAKTRLGALDARQPIKARSCFEQ